MVILWTSSRGAIIVWRLGGFGLFWDRLADRSSFSWLFTVKKLSCRGGKSLRSLLLLVLELSLKIVK